MKKLIFIIGSNRVGKTTTAEMLLQKLSSCASSGRNNRNSKYQINRKQEVKYE